MRKRSEPCVALYPALNLSNSWVFWNIKTKKRIRRSNYKCCNMTNLVIDGMNALSGAKKVVMADQSAANDDKEPM